MWHRGEKEVKQRSDERCPLCRKLKLFNKNAEPQTVHSFVPQQHVRSASSVRCMFSVPLPLRGVKVLCQRRAAHDFPSEPPHGLQRSTCQHTWAPQHNPSLLFLLTPPPLFTETRHEKCNKGRRHPVSWGLGGVESPELARVAPASLKKKNWLHLPVNDTSQEQHF